MAIVGAALTPVTAGAYLGLNIAGGVIGFTEGTTVAGSSKYKNTSIIEYS